MSNAIEVYHQLRREIESLPAHSAAEIEAAAHHLEMLHYQNLLDSVAKDFIRLTKEDVLNKLQEIAFADPPALESNPTVVEEWRNPDVSAETNRIRRMKLVAREFKMLSRLRSNEPEAWDEINELYYDD